MMTAEERVTRARIQLLKGYPFFGILSLRLVVKEDNSVPTAATNGNTLYYNTNFVDKLNDKELAFIIVHEVMHCALKHIFRIDNRKHDIWNMACDYAIHSILHQDYNSFIEMLDNCLYDEKYNEMTAEQIYEDLLQNSPQSNQNGEGQSTIDDHSKWGENEEGASGQAKSSMEQDWDSAIINAAKQAQNSNQYGNVPGYFKRYIDEITNPTKDWRIILREFIEPEPDDYTFVIPDYRLDYDTFGCFLPSFNEESQNVNGIYFWIDTSGSINNEQLNKIYSEVAGAVNQFDRFKGYLGFFDSIAYEPIEFTDIYSLKEIQPQGGGGTSFEAPFQYMIDNNLKAKTIIMLTDGYCNFPNEDIVDCPVVWLITTKDIEAPWGKTIYLDLKR